MKFMLNKLGKDGLNFSESSINILTKMIEIFERLGRDKELTIESLNKIVKMGENSKKIYLKALDYYLEGINLEESK